MPWLAAGGFAFVFAIGAAAVAIAVAWQHNPGSEFHLGPSTNWGALFGVGAPWFAPGCAGALLGARVFFGFVAGPRDGV
jgi:hypothetical protein